MKRGGLGPALAAATVAGLALGVAADAGDLDDDVRTLRSEFDAIRQNEYEVIFGGRMAKLGQLAFRDQAYGAAAALAKEPGWEALDKRYVFKPSLAAGPVFYATWSSGRKAEAQPTVVIVVHRYNHADEKGALTTKLGEAEVPNSDPLALVQAISRAWAAGLEKPAPAPDGAPAGDDAAAKADEADRQACIEASKKAVGVAKVFAARQGRLREGGSRERREWFAWSGEDATWVVCARYDGSALSKTNAALAKGAYFMGKVHAYRGVSAK